MTLKLVIFDVDGTLVDSIAQIETVVNRAFAARGYAPPPPGAVRGLVGISLPELMAALKPDLDAPAIGALVEAYKRTFVQSATREASPLFPGTLEMLSRLAGRDDLLLGIATGKSRRGLDRILRENGLERHFVTRQVADDHPSKPHPSMVLSALAETGIEAEGAVLIGDTTFDLQMAQAAGVRGIGVAWGNHAAEDLQPLANHMLGDWTALDPCLDTLWEAR
ncbi:HAD-IA family hydrolase [Jannaschia sp. CCS1]|uniref:HAD-IA family hydrolase n=1 Tax=Jannaschia sp. (strain CCS1) TaxID=290400 RepID=UPI000053C7BF|nr:HAD-IA family hydrolase [Jannaschia sp. CCS1]ABD53542.1 HAD-superfamily hydrolase subfamily IA variant 3 [Jannaschia sp. CCS1]